MQQYYEYLSGVISIAKQAGTAIMQVYATDFDVEKKSDNSPLTKADLAAHDVIIKALNQLTPDIPILSEESEHIPAEERNNWPLYWLIDPLDGTREFVKRNGEFTVNIALISGHISVLGVVYAPVTELLYYALAGQGAFKQIKHHAPFAIRTKTLTIEKVVVAGSRSHSDHKLQQFLTNMHIKTGATPELIHMGSSLKICLVADGSVDVYPRIGPTSEWDTAAAHCILTEAGGDIVDVTGSSLRYNSKRSLLNPTFFATVKTSFNWSEFL
jgi:3'(2'), 5'-bisphosphate nucleotidase